MPSPPLACTVRGCGLPLTRHDRTWTCPSRHAYDVARRGYVNLLQPQDRRSPEAGDARAAIEARAGLLAAGVGRAILDAMAARAAALPLSDEPVVVELGSGGGDLLAALARLRPIAGIGLDLSVAAAEHAARRHAGLTWVVANADRRLPLLDGRVDLVLSMHARRNPAECGRVLAPGGHLLVAVPAEDDLIELRALVQGQGVPRDRTEALVAEHHPHFRLIDRETVRERRTLGRSELVELLRGTYRGRRHSVAARVGALDRLEVTLASDLCLFAPAPPAQGSSSAAPTSRTS